MAQKLAWNGAALTESDIVTYLAGEGGAWTSWTPTVTQSGSVTVTNTRSRYARYGRTIHYSIYLTVTGSGSAANAVTISTPVTAAAASEFCGVGAISDASAGLIYPAIVQLASTTTFQMLNATTAAADQRLGVTGFSAGLANTDTIYLAGTFEAAS